MKGDIQLTNLQNGPQRIPNPSSILEMVQGWVGMGAGGGEEEASPFLNVKGEKR